MAEAIALRSVHLAFSSRLLGFRRNHGLEARLAVDSQDAGARDRRRRVARHRHRRQHRRLLVGAGGRAAAAARRAGRAAAFTSSSRAPTPGRTRARRGRSTATCASACGRFPSCSRSAWRRSRSATPGRSERIYGLLVSGNYFSALGMQPALGRFFRPDEADASRRRTGRRRSPTTSGRRASAAPRTCVGQTLRVNDQQLTVVGVAPERFPGHGARPQFRSLGAGDDGAARSRAARASSTIARCAATA